MSFHIPPSIDQVVLAALPFLGLGTAVILVAKIGFALYSWKEPVKIAYSAVGRVASVARNTSPGSVLAILVAQALTLALSYIGGCFLLTGFSGRWHTLMAILQTNPGSLTDPGTFWYFFGMNWVAGSMVILAAVVIIRSYRRHPRKDDWDGEASFLAFPAYVFALSIPEYLIALHGPPLTWVIGIPVGLLASWLYFYACQLAVRGSIVAQRAV